MQAKAPLRVHPLRHRPPGMHRPEVCHAAAEASRHPPLPQIHLQTLAQDGVSPAVPVLHFGQLQVWCQGAGHREEELMHALLLAEVLYIIFI